MSKRAARLVVAPAATTPTNPGKSSELARDFVVRSTVGAAPLLELAATLAKSLATEYASPFLPPRKMARMRRAKADLVELASEWALHARKTGWGDWWPN